MCVHECAKAQRRSTVAAVAVAAVPLAFRAALHAPHAFDVPLQRARGFVGPPQVHCSGEMPCEQAAASFLAFLRGSQPVCGSDVTKKVSCRWPGNFSGIELPPGRAGADVPGTTKYEAWQLGLYLLQACHWQRQALLAALLLRLCL